MLEKIKPEQMEEYGVVSAPDHLSGNPADVKAVFDRLVKELVAVVVNDIIDAHNGLDRDVNQRIDDVIEELKNVSEINAENLGANNIALDKKGETTLADQYQTGELAPTVWGALSRILEMFLRKGGDTMTGTLEIRKADYANVSLVNTTNKTKGLIEQGNDLLILRTSNTDANPSNHNARDLRIYNSRHTSNIRDALRFVDIVDGVYNNYPVLHAGNLELLRVTGEYVGTGDSTKTLTFPFVPKFVYVAGESGGYFLFAINGMTRTRNSFADGVDTWESQNTVLNWDGKSVTFSCVKEIGNPNYYGIPAMNRANANYRYIAIG